jgi:hypothetical protein
MSRGAVICETVVILLAVWLLGSGAYAVLQLIRMLLPRRPGRNSRRAA